MIVRGNALNIPLGDNSVHCVVTSPPYWGLRKYQGEQEILWEAEDAERSTALSGNDIFVRDSNGNDAYVESGRVVRPQSNRCAFGLEPTIEQYVEHSILILRELRRVLRDDGVRWWNLGDSYSGSGAGGGGNRKGNEHGQHDEFAETGRPRGELKPLDLCLIPERVALAAQVDGWYVRSLVIWAKPNPMPESVRGWFWEKHRIKVKIGTKHSGGVRGTGDVFHGSLHERGTPEWSDCPGCEKCSPNDGLVLRKGSWRPTDAYEHILMLAKSAGYFGDAEAVKEAQTGNAHSRGTERNTDEYYDKRGSYRGFKSPVLDLPNGRNLRNVWTFPTQPYPEAHFATSPERLPEICIKASTSEKGCCPKCGAGWVRVIEPSKSYQEFRDAERVRRGSMRSNDLERLGLTGGTSNKSVSAEMVTKGWRPSCSCNAGEPVPCTVLDPFGGSGTMARVATELGRRAVSLDLAYHGLASKRTTEIQPWMIFA